MTKEDALLITKAIDDLICRSLALFCSTDKNTDERKELYEIALRNLLHQIEKLP